MRVLVTGITGIGKKEYLGRVKECCARQGQKVAVFSLEQLMKEVDLTRSFDEATMYQRDHLYLQLLCAYALQTFASRLEAIEQKYDHVVLEMHATYFWDLAQFSIASNEHIGAWFRPDLCVVLIDDVHELFARLKVRKDSATERFLAHGNPLLHLMYWRNFEVTTVEQFVQAAHRFDEKRSLHFPGFFLLAKASGPELLARLMVESRYSQAERPRRIAYASFAISGLKGRGGARYEKIKGEVDAFRHRLAERFILLDPYTIVEKHLTDALKKGDGEKVTIPLRGGQSLEIPRSEILAVSALIEGHIIERDARLVQSAEVVVIYMPTDEHGYPIHSEGVAFERVLGWLGGRTVVVITEAEDEQLGPFRRIATHRCRTFDEAEAWFREHDWIPKE